MLFKISYQFLIKDKKRAITILISMILSVALLVGIGNFIRSANISKSEYYKKIAGNYQYTYVVDREQLKELDDITKQNKSIDEIGIAREIGFTDEPRVISLVECDTQYMNMNGMDLLEGRYPASSDEVLLEQWATNNLDMETVIGNVLEFEGVEYKVVGIVADSFEKYEQNMKAYTSLNEDTSTEGRYTAYVNFDISGNIKREATKFMKETGNSIKEMDINWDVVVPLGVKEPVDTSSLLTGWVKGLSLDENMVVVLFGLFSAFIVYSILNIAVMNRMSQYGVLLSLGCGLKKLFLIILSEILALFLVAFPIGCGLGIAVSKVLYKNLSRVFLAASVTSVDFAISKSVIVNGAFVLLAALVLVSIKTILTIQKQTNIDIIRDKNCKLLKDKRILAKDKQTFLYRLTHRYMTLKRGMFFGIIISLSIGGIIFCSANYAIKETKHQNNLTLKADDGLGSDYSIVVETTEFNEGLNENQVKKIEEVEGVRDVYPIKNFMGATYLKPNQLSSSNFFDAMNNDERLKNQFNGICTEEPNGDYLIKGNIYGYNEKMLKGLENFLIEGSLSLNDAEQEVVVYLIQDGGTGKFDTVKIKPGDTIRVKVPKELPVNGETLKFMNDDSEYSVKEFKVAATVKRVMANSRYFVGPYGIDIVMSNSLLEKEFGIDKYSMASVQKKPNVSGDQVNKEILEITEDIERCNVMDYTKLIEAENMNLQKRYLFFVGFALVIILISMFHIINSVNYLIMVRKHDFGVLRAIGLSDKGFLKMILKEALTYGICASLVMFVGTGIVSLGLFYFMKNVGFYFDLRFSLDWKYLITCAILNIVLSIGSSLFACRNILQKEIIKTIKAGE